MGLKNRVEDFVESQYNSPGHRTGRGVGEALAGLARHRKPKDLPYPLLGIGILLIILGVVGLVPLWLNSTFVNWTNALFLLVLIVLGLTFCFLGLGFLRSTRKSS
jgi:hypothetical protein